MKRYAPPLAALALTLVLVGCPSGVPIGPIDPGDDPQDQYDAGYDDGFARDDWYWDGYWDGYDTTERRPVYYDDSDIAYVEEPPYDAGFWDGIWYAYNDGYFVNYSYAFVIGFSEGYDAAFWPDYLAFLASDQHAEFANGGWGDGYNDGFSEGRVFGANDYEQGLPFDWLDALADYESGTDLYFDEVGVGTGAYGPVTLYEYGLNPVATVKARALRRATPRSLRRPVSGKQTEPGALFRPLTADARQALHVAPESASRAEHPLRLATTWLERIGEYQGLAAKRSAHDSLRNRITGNTP
jgi:hypothetical protein